MPHKKKFFNKDNSVKFLLLHGNTQAVNADGETLENVLVPISKNYKPGTSLLMSNIAALSNAEPNDELDEEPDLEKMLNEFDVSDSEVITEDLPSKIEKLNFSRPSKKCKPLDKYGNDDENDFYDDFFDANSQFSDASEYSCEQVSDDVAIDPNCPETLKMFNEKFQKVLKEYDDDQIGPLDEDDICGYASTSSKRFANLMDSEINKEEAQIILGDYDKDIKEKILNYAQDSGDEKIIEIVTERPLEFDCESILTTYSNKYNHPTVIKEDKIKKIQVPNNPLKKKLTKSQLKILNNEKESDNESDDNLSVSTTFNVRTKGETPEQRRERKNLFKEAKRESRILKKENKLAFKKEKKLQTSQSINARHNAGFKLL